MLNNKIITMFQTFLVLGLLVLYPSLGFSAGDPLKDISTNVEQGVSTFQIIALSIAGIALVLTALAGAFGRLDTNRMLQIFAAIIIIAGAAILVNWIAGFIKPN